MTHDHATLDIADLLDRLAAGPALDFDPEYEELDREFAERRLNFINH